MGRKIVPVTLKRFCSVFVGSGLTLQNDIGNPKGRTGRGTLFLYKEKAVAMAIAYNRRKYKVQKCKVHDMKKPPLSGEASKQKRTV